MNPLDIIKTKTVQDILLLLAGTAAFLVVAAVAFRISRIERVNIKKGEIEADPDNDGPPKKPTRAVKKPFLKRPGTKRRGL